MEAVIFWIFAVLMLGFACAVVFQRNPVVSALNLVVSFIFLASLFIMLNAYFIGIIQILVYAGAVMVLFLFIIMLLDLKAEKLRKLNLPALVGGLGVSVVLLSVLLRVLAAFPQGDKPFPALSEAANDDVAGVGTVLFTDFNLPFQVIGAILLAATIGVVILSKKEAK